MVWINKVVFISIDRPARWSEWHSGNTDSVYYSDFYNTEEEVIGFVHQVKLDYPDSNLIDSKCDHKYYIKYVVLDYDKNNEEGFETLRTMMRAYNSYNNRR